jgi:mycothiol synthase
MGWGWSITIGGMITTGDQDAAGGAAGAAEAGAEGAAVLRQPRLRAPWPWELARLGERLGLDGLLEVGCPLDLGRDARVAEVGGRLVGTCWVRVVSGLTVFSADGAEAFFDAVVDPDGHAEQAAAALVGWAVARATSIGTVRELLTDVSAPAAAGPLGPFGFRPDRDLHVMFHHHPDAIGTPSWPAGTSLAVAPPTAELVAAACDAAFADLPGYGGATATVVERVLSHPSTDSELCLVALRGGQLAGFCYSRVERSGGRVCGWVEDLGVARSARRIGLGRALLRHSVLALAERGAASVVLGVDAANHAARRLYETSGFTRAGALLRYRLGLR